MEFLKLKLRHTLTFLSLVLLASHAAAAASVAEDYWKSLLPNSPMPQAIKDLLVHTAEWQNDKSLSVSVGKGGVIVSTGRERPGGAAVNVGHGSVGVNTGRGKPGGTGVNVGHGSVGVGTGKPGHRTNVGVGKGGVTVGTGTKKGRPIRVGVKPGPDPFQYQYAATETQLNEDPKVALFFLEKDLRTGKKMNLDFSSTTTEATFLPRQVADSIPFSSKKFPEILRKLSVVPSSGEAEVMKKTIQECEKKGIKGEDKFCATSLESMVDFSTSKLGKNVDAISTNADEGHEQEYRVIGVKRMPKMTGVVVCHRKEYAYAVFLCHQTATTVAYEVDMIAADGSKADAVAVCHQDTAAWNPKHLAFQVLKVKPGEVPVCHFLPEDHIVWVPK